MVSRALGHEFQEIVQACKIALNRRGMLETGKVRQVKDSAREGRIRTQSRQFSRKNDERGYMMFVFTNP